MAKFTLAKLGSYGSVLARLNDLNNVLHCVAAS